LNYESTVEEIIERLEEEEYNVSFDEKDRKIKIKAGFTISFKVNNNEIREITVDNAFVHNGASYGYEEIKFIVVDEEEKITNKLLKEVEKIEDNSKWVCDFVDKGDGLLSSSLDWNEIEKEKELSGKELKEFVKEFCLSLEENYREDEAILYDGESFAGPICANNPYAYAGDTFSYEIKEDEVCLKYEYTDLLGAHYHLLKEKVVFKKV
jgi:hypothetical protein